MKAVLVRARSELRNHWRALVALCLLAGIPGGIAMAAAIGAARTDSITDRVLKASDPPDIFYIPAYQEVKLPFEDIAALPSVAEAYSMRGFGVMKGPLQDLEISATPVDFPHRFNKVLAGRFPHPDRVDETMISFKTADRFRWRVGTQITVPLLDPASDEEHDIPGPLVRLRVVGVEAAFGDLVGVAGPGIFVTDAFNRAYAPRAAGIELQVFKLRHGPRDYAAFAAQMRALAHTDVGYVEGNSDLVQVKRSFHLQAVALWVTCAFLGAVAVLIFGQAIGRQSTIEAGEYPSLRALGMTRSDLAAVGFARAAVVAVFSALIAMGVAIVMSYATPFGLARVIEPSPGFSAPAAIVAAGVAALILIVIGSAAIPSWRAALSARRERASGARPSLPARLLSFAWSGPSPSIGARFALEQGRGDTAVPVRSSMLAAIAGIVALLAALSVGVSVRHFVATPALYGWNWDVALSTSNEVRFEPGTEATNKLANDPDIKDLSLGVGIGNPIRLNGIAMDMIAVDPIKGNIEPNILEGRAPTGADEIAVGRKSLQRARAHIGSTVSIGTTGQTGVRMRVVGVAVLPFDDDTSTIGEGLWMTFQGAKRIDAKGFPDSALIRLRPGVSQKAVGKRLEKAFGVPVDVETTPGGARTPGGVRDYNQISQVPLILAGLLAALAAGTLTHMLVSSIRRRRRDLAILKTLGFERSQVRGAVLWQAGVFTAIVLAVAVPLGILVGRWTWTVIAGYGGFEPVPVVSASQFAIVGGAALLVALSIAILPARAAARTPPAVVLRTE
jgi:hypothetical protein